MKKSLLAILILIGCVAMVSARRPKVSASEQQEAATQVTETIVYGTGPAGNVSRIGSEPPRALIYSMNGNWSQYVPVTLNEEGTALVSYPAPTDITYSQTPVSVGDGLWLDRRGISNRTAFTRWTYAEYSQLKAVPSQEEIMNNLIPGAEVTEILRLPIPLSEASRDPELVRRLVAEGLKDATIIYRLPGAERIDYGRPGPMPTILTDF